ncbi:MAG: 23S rRNA (guanosine(2251)-2'-O)-methyltransferase RlmB [Candidatus Korobacteraceae bacterium]
MGLIYGINSVGEALKARGRAFQYVAISRERHDHRVHEVVKQCREQGVPVRQLPREELTRLAQSGQHQGVVAITSEKQYTDLDEILAARRGEHVLLLVLDGVEDPHNLGAALRSADAAGVHGVVIPERRAVGVTPAVAKASAGASEHVPVARVTNINRTLEDLKARNVWVVGLDERATQSYDEVDYNMDCALVLGAEGKGLHEQVRKHCDFLVRIPMKGRVPSLNVSVAAGVVMLEAARQRRQAARSRKSHAKLANASNDGR